MHISTISGLQQNYWILLPRSPLKKDGFRYQWPGWKGCRQMPQLSQRPLEETWNRWEHSVVGSPIYFWPYGAKLNHKFFPKGRESDQKRQKTENIFVQVYKIAYNIMRYISLETYHSYCQNGILWPHRHVFLKENDSLVQNQPHTPQFHHPPLWSSGVGEVEVM